jgi:4-oxalocrotonate tautomerase
MPDIVIYMKEGRSVEQKRKLVKSVTEAVVNSVSVTPDAVEIIIVDSSPNNFARGGVLLSDKKSP